MSDPVTQERPIQEPPRPRWPLILGSIVGGFLLVAVGLEHSLNVYPGQLSGGMQQRLAIAQALIKKPRVMLLDEPFGALDLGIRLDMHELITRLWKEQNLTILMVTHDIKEAFKLGTRVLAFDKRRHDPQMPHRYGSAAVYDLPLDRKTLPDPAILAQLTDQSRAPESA